LFEELILNIMNDYSQKDDRTRVGGYGNPPQPVDGQQESVPLPVPPCSYSNWQGAPEEAYPAAPPVSPSFDCYRNQRQPVPDLHQFSVPQEDLWFVADLPEGSIKYPLHNGKSVTLGRDVSQDIVIKDKTLSRSHLVLHRNGDLITVQVLGLNGLVYANQVHKSTTLDIIAPASLAIGNVGCKFDKKYDTDATILMNNPASTSRQSLRTAPANNGQFSGYRPEPPSFSSQPFASDQPVSPVFQGVMQQQPVMPPAPNPYSPSVTPGVNIEPEANVYKTLYNSGYLNGFKVDKNILMLSTCIGLAFLVIILVIFFWQRNPSPSATVVPPPVVNLAPQPTAAGLCTSLQGTNNLYSILLRKAKSYLEDGNMQDSCDYLKDIPPTSACWSEALTLSKQIENCNLE
jgi:hypothetical protein